MLRQIILLSTIAVGATALADKKPLDHTVYNNWKSLGAMAISNDGLHATYQIRPQQGDTILVLQNLKNGEQLMVPRGYNAMISADGKSAVCMIRPLFADTREARIKKKKADQMPKDSLAIINLTDNSIVKIADVKGYKSGNQLGESFAYLIPAPAEVAANDSVKSKPSAKGKAGKDNFLVVRNIITGKEDTIKKVTDYSFSYDGKQLAAIAKGDSLTRNLVMSHSVKDGKTKTIASGLPKYAKLNFDKAGRKLAFLATADTSDIYSKRFELYMYSVGQDSAYKHLDSTSKGMPDGWSISENSAPDFSENGNNLFVGLAPVVQLKDTTLVDFETAGLDIWHYQDPVIQPMQLVRSGREKKRSYIAYVNPGVKDEVTPIASNDLKEISFFNLGDSDYALGLDKNPYEFQMAWLANSIPSDMYLINIKTGERRLIGKAILGRPYVSPQGSYVAWFDPKTQDYFSYDVADNTIRNLTEGMNVKFYDEEDDVPIEAREYGVAGWLSADKGLLVYDNFDIWQLDPKGVKQPVCITSGEGRNNNTVLRYIRLDKEKRSFEKKDELLLAAFDKVTKKKGYYTLNLSGNKLKQCIVEGFNYMGEVKARNANVFAFVKANFTTSPEVYVTKDYWTTSRCLSDINPQMKDYNWGTSELYNWTTFSGKPAEGILYKPENFDPEKKYPVIIYFYERLSDNLYNYVSPAPSRSTINISFYTSRGYVVFTPDIRYTIGQPGESAYDYIVSGAEQLAKNEWINKDKIAIQGQSWGGYQVAYLITRTNMFAAAGSGAPVSNMTSAYGGIRWATGMSRQYQYENTQSRIGGTLWEKFDDYVKNSPVFFADKVNTPVLIMHNDNDGAVPWYQGIELFMALRRLGKASWMLQYNKEEHNLIHRRNMNDLVVRYQQFFDHYLKDEPMPAWMKDGVPATRKGMYFGFEDAEN